MISYEVFLSDRTRAAMTAGGQVLLVLLVLLVPTNAPSPASRPA